LKPSKAVAAQSLRGQSVPVAEDARPWGLRAVRLEGIPELHPFVRAGRLAKIPRKHSTRLTLLDLLAQAFEPGRHYAEADVNAVLRAVHSDFAALRRYLVDEGFLDREVLAQWWIRQHEVAADR